MNVNNSNDEEKDKDRAYYNEVIEKLESINLNNLCFSILRLNFLQKFPFLNDYIDISEKNIENDNNEISIKQKKSSETQKIAVIYHHPCFDGSYSAINAYIFYSYFSNKKNQLNFFKMSNSNRLENILENQTLEDYNKIYILDKGLSHEDFEYLYYLLNENSVKMDIENNNKIVVVDHHISSIDIYTKDYKNKFDKFNNVVFIFEKEEKRSACGITFDIFYNKALRKIKKILIKNSEIIEFNKETIIDEISKENSLLKEKFVLLKKHFSPEYKKVN